MDTPFQPVGSGTIAVANATSATTPALLPADAEQVALHNTSATATAYWACQRIGNEDAAGRSAVVPIVGTNGDMPIPPGVQIRLTVGRGPKKFSIISSAADGNLLITPGRGD